jgi:hypothetical protein
VGAAASDKQPRVDKLENFKLRKVLGIVAAGLLTLGVAGQAHAVALGFTGALAISLAGNTVPAPGAGTATVNGSGAAGHLTGLAIPAGAFAVNAFVLPVTDPAAAPIGGLKVTVANAAGNFAGVGGSGFGGQMPLNGTTKVCLFGPCSAPAANISVPLNVIGGPAGGAVAVGAFVNVTVVGAPWTTGTAAVGTVTVMGGVSPLSNTGAPSGLVTLVTPIFISTNIPASAVVPGFGFVNLHFVPEPGTLVLLGSGIAGLVAFGRSRRS